MFALHRKKTGGSGRGCIGSCAGGRVEGIAVAAKKSKGGRIPPCANLVDIPASQAKRAKFGKKLMFSTAKKAV